GAAAAHLCQDRGVSRTAGSIRTEGGPGDAGRLPRFSFPGVLFTWSGVILLGGAVEILNIHRSGRQPAKHPRHLGAAPLSQPRLRRPRLSAVLIWQGLAWVPSPGEPGERRYHEGC